MLTIEAAGVDPAHRQANDYEKVTGVPAVESRRDQPAHLQHNVVAIIEVMFQYRKKCAYLGKVYSGRDNDHALEI
jgi:hypothetical protein